jgi:hypothetical protein
MGSVHRYQPRLGGEVGQSLVAARVRPPDVSEFDDLHTSSGGVAAERRAVDVVNAVVEELCLMVGHREGAFAGQTRGRERRAAVHRRQIAMYVAHVVLRLSLTDIGIVYGRDRTTVGHACNVVEDRRDDAAYDRFVAGIERIVGSALELRGVSHGH